MFLCSLHSLSFFALVSTVVEKQTVLGIIFIQNVFMQLGLEQGLKSSDIIVFCENTCATMFLDFVQFLFLPVPEKDVSGVEILHIVAPSIGA